MLDGKGEAVEGMVVGETAVVDISPGYIDAVLAGIGVTVALADIVPVTRIIEIEVVIALAEGLMPSACAVRNNSCTLNYKLNVIMLYV